MRMTRVKIRPNNPRNVRSAPVPLRRGIIAQPDDDPDDDADVESEFADAQGG